MITTTGTPPAGTLSKVSFNAAYVWMISAVAAMGGLLFGYDLIVISGTAMSVAVTALWIACFVLTETFPLLREKLGAAITFWIYAAICAFGFFLFKSKLPETKGKTLEQIEKDLVD